MKLNITPIKKTENLLLSSQNRDKREQVDTAPIDLRNTAKSPSEDTIRNGRQI